jgi:hypothetical protein
VRSLKDLRKKLTEERNKLGEQVKVLNKKNRKAD